jgi:hypothetical protein
MLTEVPAISWSFCGVSGRRDVAVLLVAAVDVLVGVVGHGIRCFVGY